MSPSIWQMLIVAAIILLLFGPKRIPGLGKSLGEAIRGFKKGLDDDETEAAKPSAISSSSHSNSSKKEQIENLSNSQGDIHTSTHLSTPSPKGAMKREDNAQL